MHCISRSGRKIFVKLNTVIIFGDKKMRETNMDPDFTQLRI